MTLIPPGLSGREELPKRSIPAGLMTFQLPTTSSTDEFMDAKIERLAADIAMGTRFKEVFGIARSRKALTGSEFEGSSRQANLQ